MGRIICYNTGMLLETYDTVWDYKLLDTGNSQRLEQWGEIRLIRPDPQAIWSPHSPVKLWEDAHASFDKTWKILKPVPQSWSINWQNIKLIAKLSSFKHTGIFAEQAANWEWCSQRLQVDSKKPNSKIQDSRFKILNLFGYTGAATVILAKQGHFVTHVDASKPAIGWAKENQKANNLSEKSIRWILEDAGKFVKKELRRGEKYDAILMDPPAFGHSPSGKTWKFNEDISELLADCINLLSNEAKFLLINGYATNSSALALNNLLEDSTKNIDGRITFGELCLKQTDGRTISTGIFSRWQK